MGILFALALAYLLGAIPTGYWLLKLTRGIDIRQSGSGNIGATNAARTGGKILGVTVLLLDILKGWLASAILPIWLISPIEPGTRLLCGTVAVLGHVYSCFLGFQGGKGVATALGALAGSSPMILGLVLIVWVVAAAMTRYVSVASMLAAAAMPIVHYLLHRPQPDVLLSVALAGLIVIRHQGNLDRLRAGTEHRLGAKKGRT